MVVVALGPLSSMNLLKLGGRTALLGGVGAGSEVACRGVGATCAGEIVCVAKLAVTIGLDKGSDDVMMCCLLVLL